MHDKQEKIQKKTCNLKQTLFILCTGEVMQKKYAKSIFRPKTVVDNIRNIPNANPHKTYTCLLWVCALMVKLLV